MKKGQEVILVEEEQKRAKVKSANNKQKDDDEEEDLKKKPWRHNMRKEITKEESKGDNYSSARLLIWMCPEPV